MEIDTPTRLDRDVKTEDDGAGDLRMADAKPTYRSWKKKYRKMRIIFDQKMHEGEDLHKLEQKALETARRLAIEKDRLLDLLLDVNNSPQIPTDKRIDLSLDPPSDEDLALSIDIPGGPASGPQPDKSYKKLLAEVPHFSFASAAERFPELLADLEAGRDSPGDPLQGQPHPPTFLTADEIDNYIYEIDTHLASKSTAADPPPLLPTLAPLAHGGHVGTSTTYAAGHANGITAAGAAKDAAHSANRDFALRNPTSVYNWLRKHAPKTFLQDAEAAHPDRDHGHGGGDDSTTAAAAAAAAAGGGPGGRDHHHHHAHEGSGRTPGRGGGRGGRGTGERGGSARGAGGGGGGSAARAKRPGPAAQRRAAAVAAAAAAAASAAAATASAGEPMDFDDDASMAGVEQQPSTPVPGTAKGKRKRVAPSGGGGGDDDHGYRPKGGSSRPAKKKRKSEGDATPTSATGSGPALKKSRKSGGVAEKDKERERERGEKDRGEEKDGGEEKDAIIAKV